MFPVRIDVRDCLIYTLVPTKDMNWVEYVNGDEVYFGEPYVMVQETVVTPLLTAIPEMRVIDIAEEINTDYLILVPGLSVEGTFVFQFKRATMEEVQSFGMELNEEIAIRQERGELPPEL